MRATSTLLGLPITTLASLAALSLAGCPTTAVTPDAAMSADTNAVGADGGPTFAITFPVATTGEMREGTPAFACRGTATAPVAGAPIASTFQLTIFGGLAGRPAGNTRIQLFRDNVITATCAAPDCQEFTTDAMGQAPAMTLSGGWYAYRVFQNLTGGTDATRFTDSVQYNKAAPTTAGGTAEGNAISLATINLIPASLGLEREAGTTLLAGRVQDCAGTNIEGAIVRAFRPDGTEIAEAPADVSTGVHYRYFRRFGTESRPSNDQETTNFEGLFGAINIPVLPGRIRVETWLKPSATAEPTLAGCESIQVLPNGVSTINIGGLRNDYASEDPCSIYNP
jgi:hypothetical protein